MPPSSCLPDRESDTEVFSMGSALLSPVHNEYAVIQRIISAERGRVAEWRFFYRIFTKDLEKRRKPNDSKELIHPVDILGFHLGGSSAVVFCTTDSQCVYGTLLSLDLCMFSSQTNLVRNWQMQGVKYWLCLCVRANVAACQCVCVRTCVCVCFFGCYPGFISVCYQGDVSHFHLPHVPSFFVFLIKDRKLSLNQISITTPIAN